MTASSISLAPRSCAALVAVLCASLALAPVATASMITTPPDRADGLGGAGGTTHVAVVLPPDRADGLGGSAAAVHAAFTPPPDRVDGLGGSRFTSVSTPVPAPTASIGTSSTFDWTAAFVGAIAGLAIALLTMAALLTRRHRDVALPS